MIPVPTHNILTFAKDSSFKLSAKKFWLVSSTTDAYGKQICEGDRVRAVDEMYTYTVAFDGNAFIMLDSCGAINGLLADFDPLTLEIVGHVTDDY